MIVSKCDVTELERTQEELARKAQELTRANSELEDFTYSVSHDLKEPLRAIEAFSSFLAEDYSEQLDEEGRRYVSVVRENAVRMRDLIEDLLRLSRIGRIQHEHTTVSAEALVEDVCRDLAFAIEEKKVDLRVQPGLPKILCDEVHMKQVFKNLISNAIKFNDKPRPMVEVTCRDENGAYRFSIGDNGIGIDKQYHEKIFKIFQRLNRREDYKDTGVGLTICKKVVEAHGGTIWVEESRAGEGTTFSFTIPKEPQRAEEAGGKQVGQATGAGQHPAG